MTESVKTLLFVAAAALAVLAAVLTRPSLYTAGPGDMRGQLLFPHFKDPLSVASMEITEFEEDNATLERFRVTETEQNGKMRWAIPSHEDYPADATQQVGAAAVSLKGLKAISVVSEDQGEQKTYDVVDPDPKTLKVGDVGVGMRVVMRDKEGKTLADLIIGKEVRDRAGLRYVRKPGQDPIYIAEIKTDNLSTKFENWIERNLLDIKTIDMAGLKIRDYAIRTTADGGGELDQRRKIDLDYNDAADVKWKLVDDERFLLTRRGGKWAPVKMAADEELDVARLDSLRTALDDLQIVDVDRKPPGLSADLKVSADLSRKQSSVDALADKGFYAGRLSQSGSVELFSNDGEIRVEMKDGVEYVLRFGDIAGHGAAKKGDKENRKGKPAEKGAKKEDEKKEGGGLNRYVLVMAEPNPDLIPKPAFEPLPEFKPETEPPKAAAAPAKPADKKPDAKQPEVKKPADKKPDAKGNAAGGKPEKKAELQKPAPKTKEQLTAERKAFEARRARVEKDNKRKQEEYERALADGRKRVDELNARFADWYYVISDDVYRKIHLSRDEIVKKKEKPKAKGKDAKRGGPGDAPGSPMDQFEKLKGEGPQDEP